MGLLWAYIASGPYPDVPGDFIPPSLLIYVAAARFLQMFLLWLLVAMAVLDAEHLWLPNFLTMPGIAIGFASAVIDPIILLKLDSLTGPPLTEGMGRDEVWSLDAGVSRLVAILAAAGLILLIRWLYKLIRKREGMGLGDAKLMAMLAAWLGLPGALLAFGLGAILGSIAALALLAVPAARRGSESWSGMKLPFGTFLCIGGIVSALWGQPMIGAYLRWAGF